MSAEQLLLAKIRDFDVNVHQRLIKFPKYERSFLTQEIMQSLHEIQLKSIALVKSYYTKTLLKEIDIQIEFMRFKLYKSYILKYINSNAFDMLLVDMNEIGRIFGSLFKRFTKQDYTKVNDNILKKGIPPKDDVVQTVNCDISDILHDINKDTKSKLKLKSRGMSWDEVKIPEFISIKNKNKKNKK